MKFVFDDIIDRLYYYYFLDKAKHDKHFFCRRLINHFVHKVSRKVPKIKNLFIYL